MAERKKPRSPKGEPQWDNKPPGFQQSYPFTDEIIQELADLCGIDNDEDHDRLAEALEEVSGPLQAFAYMKDTDIPIRDQRAALQKLKKSADKLARQLSALDLSTRRSIFSVYRNGRFDHGPDIAITSLDLFKRDIDHVDRLRQGIDDALAALPSSGGRPAQSPLHFLCRENIEIYERFSGEKFTFDRAPDVQGSSTFLTNGSEFVERVAKALFPDATDANIAVAIRKAQAERRY